MYERYDAATDQIAAVYQKADVLKAIVYFKRSGSPHYACNFWGPRGPESLLDERQRAIDFAEFEIKHCGQTPNSVPDSDSN